jgi:S1-C subfamily serine protease
MLADDWAYVKIPHSSSSLVADYKASVSLHAGEEIHVLGFPVGLGVADGSSFIEPIYNKMSVSRDNLNSAGCIMISQGADHGNSGGPVFAIRNNHLVVVGIMSRGDPNSYQYNHIVPIQQIK